MTLLRKMGREDVRITHGASEKGKDIVFYGPSGLLERSLFACVVKNERIVGSIGNRTSAKEVLQQAEQAFSEPFVNPNNGQLERVKGVYIISPHESPQSAVESIASELNRRGPVEFFCGSRLFGLFSDYWKEFLLFDSSLLVSYLSSLKSALNRDQHMIELFIRNSLLSEVPHEFREMYVQQTFSHRLHKWKLSPLIDSPLVLPTKAVKQAELFAFQKQLKQLLSIVDYCQLSSASDCNGSEWEEDSNNIKRFVDNIDRDWKNAYLSFSADAAHDFRSLTNEAGREKAAQRHGLRSLRILGAGAANIPSERKAELDLVLSEKTKKSQELADSSRRKIRDLLDDKISIVDHRLEKSVGVVFEINDEAALANGFLLGLFEASPACVEVEEFLSRCSVYDHDIIADAERLVLLVGPAGSGKTSFCKSHAIRDAENCLRNHDSRLPVYVPLHRFATSIPESLEDAFLFAPDLRPLIGANPDVPVRLYLDGLDEIPDTERQKTIITFARVAIECNPRLGITITARNHIHGPWLSNIPRVYVDELTDDQQRMLARKWLVTDAAMDEFFSHLRNVPPLKKVMGIPFLATLIIAVYRHQKTLPPNRVSLYKLFVELLCGSWDAVRGIHRQGRFGMHDKRLVLIRLAMLNHLARRRDASDSNLRSAIKGSLEALLPAWMDLRDELVSDGLLISTGVTLRFSHLSFQEYLASEGLSDPSGSRAAHSLKEFFRGDDWWKEVLTFYVARQGHPPETESWLIREARRCFKTASSKAITGGELDGRLNYLRGILRESFPSFTSEFPSDGVVVETQRTKRNGEIYVREQRRRLSGAIVDCDSALAGLGPNTMPPGARRRRSSPDG